MARTLATHVDGVVPAELLEDDGDRRRGIWPVERRLTVVGKRGRALNSHRMVLADFDCAGGVSEIGDRREYGPAALAIADLHAVVAVVEVIRVGGMRDSGTRE